MKKLLLLHLLLALLISACSTKSNYEKLQDGVVVTLNTKEGGAKRVKLQVISDDIIHVTATPADTFSTAQSLVVLPEVKGFTSWKLEESSDALTLVTKSLRAKILLATGEVSFTGNIFREAVYLRSFQKFVLNLVFYFCFFKLIAFNIVVGCKATFFTILCKKFQCA